MNSRSDAGRLYRQTTGTCHRCGWKGRVSKIGRGDRWRFNIDRSCRRICADCGSDLLRHEQDVRGRYSGERTKLHLHRDRDVA